MSITNGYITRAELKAQLGIGETYTATTISFTASTKTIADTAQGFAVFLTGDKITISGSTKVGNNGTFSVATGGQDASIVTTESLTDEAAGTSITISKHDTADDAKLDIVAETASRVIDEITGTRFYSTASDETRYYTPKFDDWFVCPDDILSVTTLATDEDGDRTYENTWDTADFDLMPFNAQTDTPAKPYREIGVTPNGDYVFPVDVSKSLKIIGKFGYSSSTPTRIKEACLLLSARFFKRKDAPFALAGRAEFGVLRQIAQEDPDVQNCLMGYSRLVG